LGFPPPAPEPSEKVANRGVSGTFPPLGARLRFSRRIWTSGRVEFLMKKLTTKQTHKQTKKHPNKQHKTNNQTNIQTNKPNVLKRTNKQPNEQTKKQTN